MTPAATDDTRLDDQNPWPGLGPFEEDAERFFNGRDAEAAALLRLVRDAPLTILFSRSGLGKTSLLKAGLFPRVRLEHYLPVYVRLAVQDRQRPLMEQVAESLFTELKSSGAEITPVRRADESLWQYLHRRDLELWSRLNHPLTPLVVLDQFEEVFTLGATNAAAVEQFRLDLGDLVENRIPARLARQHEVGDAATPDLELRRQRYRVLLSLREDFLPAIEGWKTGMPSLTRNRIRLMPLDGAHAFEAVHTTAPKIAPAPVAARIVAIVAASRGGGGEREASGATNGGPETTETTGTTVTTETRLDALVVEPALLSLVCRRLNERRKEAGKQSFDETLLAGAVPAILDEFYRSCLDDQPDRVKRFVAEALITEGGFRNLYAMDDALRAYGITNDQLRKLVDRRLLRVEPYQGIDRIELIHDVLTPRLREERQRFRDADRKAREEKQARQRLLRTGLPIALVLAASAVALAGWAWRQRRAALTEQQTSEARRIAAVASARLGTNPEVAALLALSSLKRAPTTEGEGVLRRALFRIPVAVLQGQRRAIRRVEFSPDGERLAVSVAGEAVWIWQSRRRSEPRQLHLAGSDGEVLLWSPDGKRLVTAGDKLTVWDSETGDRIRDLFTAATSSTSPSPSGAPRVAATAFDPSGGLLAGSWAGGKTIAVWDAIDGSLRRVVDVAAFNVPLVALLFAPDGRQLIAVTAWGDVLTWDLHEPSRSPRAVSLKLEAPVVTAAALSRDGRTIALGGGVPPGRNERGSGFVRLVGLDGKPVAELNGQDSKVLDIAMSADDRTVVSAGLDGTVCIWDVPSRGLVSRLRAHAGPVRSISVDPTGERFASGGDDQIARIWNSAPLPSVSLEGHQGQVASVAFSPEGDGVVTGGIDGTVRLWNAVDGTLIHTLSGHRDHVYAVSMSPDGRLVASGGGRLLAGGGGSGGDTTVRLWNRADGKPIWEFGENKDAVMAVAFSPDGGSLASASADPAIRVWNVRTHRLSREIPGSGTASMTLSYSPDGALLAAAGADGVARVWRPTNGELVATLGEPGVTLTSAIFGRGGTRLLTTTVSNREIIVWDVASMTVVQRFTGLAGANNADFSWSGLLALTAETEGSPKLWDVTNGVLLASLVPSSGAWSVAFSSDMRRIAAGSVNGAHVWGCQVCGAPLAELRDVARERLGRDLGKTELEALLAE